MPDPHKIGLDIVVPEWLVSAPGSRVSARGHVVQLVSTLLGAKVRRRNALVSVWSLLNNDLLMARFARAAAHRDGPEEA